MKVTSLFAEVAELPMVEFFKLNIAFTKDESPDKCNLGVGAYRTDQGEPWVLPVVKEAEKKIVEDLTLYHEYVNYPGIESFNTVSTKLLFGGSCAAVAENRVATAQTLSGTGALRLGAEFARKVLGIKTVYFSNPTWTNHYETFHYAGFTSIREYRYWDPVKKCLDIKGMLQDLEEAPEGSLFLIQTCAHNPTGCDPTREQWKQIADVTHRRRLFPFFDSAYLGFVSGDPEMDSWPLRMFVKQGFELLTAMSFSKNFGLYDGRCGILSVVTKTRSVVSSVHSQLATLIASLYMAPPSHGARIVSQILSNYNLTQEWLACVRKMSTRISSLRKSLRDHLEHIETPGKWDHITEQIGMFSYTGLNEQQVEFLLDRHIYLMQSGRINISGINANNVEYIARSIKDAIAAFPDTT